jgi:leucyl-tRNA synthetase
MTLKANKTTKDEIKEILYKDEKVLPFIEGKQIKKLIIIPRRLINVIV